MRRSWPFLVVALALGVGAVALACGSSSESTSTESPSESPPPPPTSAAPAEARAVWQEEGFELRSDAPGPYTAGSEGHFAIRLTPRGEYHVNEQYPISVTLTGPSGVTFPSTTLAAEQAQTLTQQMAAFDVPFTAGAAGAQHVTALVDFAVCTAEACMPDSRTVAIDLTVN